MPKQLQTEEIGGGGKTIGKPGTYHCSVTHAAEDESTRGNTMNGVSALLCVQAGTNEDQVEKEFHLHLYDPKHDQSDAAQLWARKKQTALAVATNQLAPADVGGDVEIDFNKCTGHQLVIVLEESTYNDKTKLDLSFANIYHVDDPRIKGIPKSESALGLIPEQFRKKPSFFDPLLGLKDSAKPAAASSNIDDALDGI